MELRKFRGFLTGRTLPSASGQADNRGFPSCWRKWFRKLFGQMSPGQIPPVSAA